MNLYALLIGIDCYLPNSLPDGSYYPSLSGCVRDITLTKKFLQDKLGLSEERVLILKASKTGSIEPAEPREEWPTYENMVFAFQRLTEIAQSGDQVYIHYSGHGGRTPTKFPELKTNGLDESLVPTDIGNSEARYLRDVELAHILRKMVDKELIVTIVLDSCHSGGATRQSAARGIGRIDTTERNTQSLVASDEKLIITWQSWTQETSRNLKLGSGWLPEAKGYVLLAACCPSEAANEYPFDGIGNNGALTYWLLDSLKRIDASATYKQIHARILAKVHSQFKFQTPQLEGESNRVVFRMDLVQLQHAVNVTEVDLSNHRVKLQTGQTQAVYKGTQFAIYPADVMDFTQVNQRIALVEITELGATSSWASITSMLRSVPIEQGFQAVFLDIGTIRLHRTVRLVFQNILPPTIDQHEALQKIEAALTQRGGGFLVLAEDEQPADYQVTVNSEEEYEIWDSGEQPIPNLRPALQIDDSGAAFQVVQRLVHLTKYHNIQQLDNSDPMSPLAGKLMVELAGVQSDYDPVDSPKPQPLDDIGNTPTLKVGDWVFVRVRNASSQVLNITVLALQADWSIVQIYPSDQDTDFWSFDPGEEKLLPLQGSLPPGCMGATDIIKALATVGATSFRWLELPALDQLSTNHVNIQRKLTNPIEELLKVLVVEEPEERNLKPVSYPSRKWVAKQVKVRVQYPWQ